MKNRIWFAGTTIEKLCLAAAGLLLAGTLIVTALGTEYFPFSNYPMYSVVQPERIRLTFRIREAAGAVRLVQPVEIAPLGRLHLGYLLRSAAGGNPRATLQTQSLAEGLLERHPEFLAIDVVAVQINRANDNSDLFQINVLKTLRSYSRAQVNP